MKNFLIFAALFAIIPGINSQELNYDKLKSASGFFCENKGQFCDQNYNSRPDVLFGGTDGALVYHIRNNGISYQLYSNTDPSQRDKKQSRNLSIYRADAYWLNCNLKAEIIKDEAAPGHINYFLEQCPTGALNVHTYNGFTLKGIYRGIDLHYYHVNNKMKCDYIVSPNADFKQIQIKIAGAQIIQNKDGSLLLKTPLGNIQEGKPTVYQNGRIIPSAYVVKNNVVSFELGAYDPELPLVIDPLIRIWGTYYGGTQQDTPTAIDTDASGNVYFSGYTASGTTTLIATVGSFQQNAGSWLLTNDAFLVKFNSAGVRQWGTFYGGTGDDYGYSCAVDASGNVFMVGQTTTSTSAVMTTPGSFQTTYPLAACGFIVEFNTSGMRQWGTYFGTGNAESFRWVHVDVAGDVVIVGSSISSTLVPTPGCQQAVAQGTTDAIIEKFSASGSRIWGTFYGGAGMDYGNGCYTDAAGNIFLTGQTTSSVGTWIPSAGGHQTVAGGGTDAFLAKFNSSGIRQWGTYYGGPGTDIAYSCVTDNGGNVYMTGQTIGAGGTVIATPGSQQSTAAGTDDGFLVKFNSAGVRQWGTYYGGTTTDKSFAVFTDQSSNILMVGQTNSTNNIASPGAYQPVLNGGDGMIAKFDQTGTRLWGTYFGGSGGDGLSSGCADLNNNIYILGQTGTPSGTEIATPGALQTSWTPPNGADAFLERLRDCPAFGVSIGSINPVCEGSTLILNGNVTYTGSLSYLWSGPNNYTSAIQNPTISNIQTNQAGVYTFSVADNLGCSEAVQTTVTVNTTTISVNSGSICMGNSFTMTPSGANTYTFQGGSAVVSPTASSSFTVIGTSTAGCISQSFAVSNVSVVPNPVITVNSGTICSGNSFTIIPNGASSYTFQGGSAIVSPTASTSYTVIGMSSAGCVSQTYAVSTVTVNALPLPTISVNSGSICLGDSFTITPTGANSYTIQGGNAVISPTANSVYTVIGTSTAGCISPSFASASVTVNALPTLSISGNNTICVGDTTALTASGASSYSWNTGAVTASIVVSPTANTTYTVVGTSTTGCSGTLTLSLLVNPCTGIFVHSAPDANLLFYPNPSEGLFTFELKNALPKNIEVIDFLGRIIVASKTSEDLFSIDLGLLPNGIYSVKIESDNILRVIRAVKQ